MGARCTDVRANELLIVVRECCTLTWNNARCYIVRHMCLHLMVMDRVDQRMSVALGCCTIGWQQFLVAYVLGFAVS